MKSENLVRHFTAFAMSQNIDRPRAMHVLEDVLRTLIQKEFGTSDNFHIVINPDKGDLQIWHYREIIADDSEEAGAKDKITLSEAQKISPDFEVGEEVAKEIGLEKFGRRAINQGLELFRKKVQDIKRDALYERYKELEGELIYAEVYHLNTRFAILHDSEKNELLLPKENQIPNEKYKRGGYTHAIIEEVSVHNHRLRIILTRTSVSFLEKTLENQIDEIADKIVKIRKIARRPGQRAKVVVSTEDDRIDPVGACVGSGGQRIRNISRRELWNEQIDIIGYTDNEELFVKRVLSPAQVHKIQQVNDRVAVYLKPDQVPLAIGVEGQNIHLASELIGKPIDVYRELTSGQEITIQELTKELGDSFTESLVTIGIKTIDDVIRLPKATLQTKTGLSQEDTEKLYALISKKYALNPSNSTPKLPNET
ncbi:MAG: transcription termination factor NusA [Bacteroidota bacterium]